MVNQNIIDNNDFSTAAEIIKLVSGLPESGTDTDVTLDMQTGQFDIFCREHPEISLSKIAGSVDIGDETISTDQFITKAIDEEVVDGCRIWQIHMESTRHTIKWHWTLVKRNNDVYVLASLENYGQQSIEISNLSIVHINGHDSHLGIGPDIDNTRFFRWHTWDMGVELLSYIDQEYRSENILHLFNPQNKTVFFCGFLTLSRMHTSHTLIRRADNNASEYYARCLFGRYVLASGEKFNSELLNICNYEDPYTALEEWASKINHIYNPRVSIRPPVGWTDNCWASRSLNEDDNLESYIMQNTKAIRKRLKGFDVEYMWISQQNLKDYIPGNWLSENTDEIPGGLANLSDFLYQMGFKPGLWVSPFWFYGEAENMVEQQQKNLLKDKKGDPVCREEPWGWQYDDDLSWYHMHRYYLDGSHPKTLNYISDLFRHYHKLGIRYYMLDFLDVDDQSCLYNQKMTPQQAGYSILNAIRNVSGEHTHIQTAVASSAAFTGMINAARIGRDFGEGRPLQGRYLSDWRNATHVLHDLHYANTRSFLQNIAANYFTHQKMYMNDLNLMTLDKPYPLEHAKIVATLFGMNGGSPLMLGDDFLRLTDDRLRLIKLCLPRTNDSPRPVDLFERIEPLDYCRILKLEIKTEWDSYLVVGVFNMDDNPYGLQLDFKQLGLDDADKYVIYDFWNEEYCGVFRLRYPCIVSGNACKLFRISQARPYPWLLSTDMHIQQGMVEILDMKWNEQNEVLSGTVTRPVGETGNIYILMPRQYQLINTSGVSLLKELIDFSVVIRLPVVFDVEIKHFKLFFKKWELGLLAPIGLIPYSTEEEWLDYMQKHYALGGNKSFRVV